MNYSKWDKLDVSDSDEEDSGPTSPFPFNPLSMMGMNTGNAAESGHDADQMFPRYFFSDPKSWIPHVSPHTGRIENWGLPEEDYISVMNRKMATQISYGFGQNAIDPPPKRFVKKLIEHKKEKLAAARPSIEHLFKRDFIIKVHLEGITPEIWRRIRVSGGISLHVLHDKVLGPAMGWVRNYHGYKFTDYRDGACIGAVATNAVDMMHIDKDGYAFLDCKLVKLAEILNKEKDYMGYLYDLGDQWSHIITLETILPEDQSDGKCEILAGARSCPPEDMGSIHAYKEAVDLFKSGKKNKEYKESYGRCLHALNVKEIQGHNFDPEYFNLNQMNERLKDAFRSTAAPDYGQKVFQTSFSNPSKGFEMQETINTGKDKKKDAMCFVCGNVNNLKLCSTCKRAYYCSRDCQKNDWKSHKLVCKPPTDVTTKSKPKS